MDYHRLSLPRTNASFTRISISHWALAPSFRALSWIATWDSNVARASRPRLSTSFDLAPLALKETAGLIRIHSNPTHDGLLL